MSLWSWPWSEWPRFDEAIFEVDRRRIVRWYEARGFHGARIREIELSASGEAVTDTRRCTTESCALDIRIVIEEGQPTHVAEVVLMGSAGQELEPALRADLQQVLRLAPGRRFDEALYEADKESLQVRLEELGHARAQVSGVVHVDRVRRTARITYELAPGPVCFFGPLRVEGHRELDASLIADVADIREGARFDRRVLSDAEAAVFALGAFSSVRIELRMRGFDIVDPVMHVTPGRLERVRLGVGVMSGTLQRGFADELLSVPQWDLHLRAAYRHENFLGGMRRLRIEERPRLIMLQDFPRIPDFGPRVGNALTVSLEQPRFIERRTVLFVENLWDVGPDPFLGFFRHDLSTRAGVRRPFLRGTVLLELALQHDLFELFDVGPPTVSSYRLPFVEQRVRLDLRNDPQRPSRGIYLSSTTQQALRLGDYGSWDYLRFLPEARGYLRLPLRIVLAQRLAFGAIFLFSSDPALDPLSAEIGPQTYRLRGGGANSNRGFPAGRLGAGLEGGKRRWESSTELRVPLAEDFGLTLFFDMGDVSQTAGVRLHHVNAAFGFGLRYFTPFAPIRFDAGYRIPGLQVIGEPEPELEIGLLPSAIHLTIGEAF